MVAAINFLPRLTITNSKSVTSCLTHAMNDLALSCVKQPDVYNVNGNIPIKKHNSA